MKFRTLSIFAAAAVVSLTACGGDEAEEEAMPVDSVATPEVAPLPPPPPMDTMPMDSMAHDSMAHDSTP